MMIIYGMDKELENEEIVDTLIKQNFLEVESERLRKTIKPGFRPGPKTGRRCHLVIELDNYARKELLATDKVFIGYEALTVRDFIFIPSCYKCNDIGQKERYYNQPARCKHCASENHKEESCSNKNKPKIKCIPCYLKNKNCYADKQQECLSYRLAQGRVVTRIDYGQIELSTCQCPKFKNSIK